MEQQFSLSWNNFHGNLTNGFSTLLANSEFVDVTLAVDGQLLQAHKIVLSICSPYFKRMFKLNPCQHPIVVLRGVTVKAMRDLLQFIYHGEVSVRQEDLTSFISTAEILQIKGLTNKTADDEGSESGRPTPQNVVSRDARRTPSDSPREAHADSVPPILEQNNIAEHQQQLFNRLAALKRKSDIFQTNIYNNSVVSDAESHSEEKRYKPNGGRRSVALDVHAKLFSYDGANHEPQPTNLCLEHDEPSPSAVDDAHIGDVKTETDEPTYSLTQRRYSDSVLANGTSDEHVRHDADSNGKDDGIDMFGLDEGLRPGVGLPRLSLHTIVTIPQKEDGKKKYPQRSCRTCWRSGRRRDTRFMCAECTIPLCKTSCFDEHLCEVLNTSKDVFKKLIK